MFEINIFTIFTTAELLREFLNNGGYVDLINSEIYTKKEAECEFKQVLEDHYKEEPDDHDYFFADYCEENMMFSYQDLINLDRKWNWEVINLEDQEYNTLLIIAIEN